jgi:hypothetical protein
LTHEPMYCAEGEFPMKPFAKWKNAKVMKSSHDRRSLKCQGEIIHAFDLHQLDAQKYRVYTNCQHNEMISFHNRYFAETQEPSFKDVDWVLMDTIIDELVESIRLEGGYEPGTVDITELINSRQPRLRKRYTKAYNQLLDDGCPSLHEISRVQPVLKKEKMKPGKAPRFVMSRDTRFTMLMLMFVQPIEQAFSKLEQVGIGKNFLQRGKAFADHVLGDVMAKTDFTMFDASKRVEFRKRVTFSVYEKLMGPELFKVFRPYLFETLATRGTTLMGHKFKMEGCEISGEASTILDNTMDNWLMTEYYLRFNQQESRKFNVMGDDGALRLRTKDALVDTYAFFGFKIKLEIVTDYHDIDYCSSKFIQITPGTFYQVQNLRTLLDKVAYLINPSYYGAVDDYYASIGHMYMVLYSGIPIYEDLGRWLRSSVKGKHFANLEYLQASYGHFDAFKNTGKTVFAVDKHTAMSEIQYAFDYSQAEIDALFVMFSTSLKFPPNYCGKRRAPDGARVERGTMVDPLILVSKMQLTRDRGIDNPNQQH